MSSFLQPSPNHRVESNRCQASRLRRWWVIEDSFCVCDLALSAAVAHSRRSAASGCQRRFRAHRTSRFGSREPGPSARVVERFTARADSSAARRVGALFWRCRSVSACSFAPRLAHVREWLDDGDTSELSDGDDRVFDATAEPSGRDEPLPSVSVTELASNWGQFSRLPRCADGSGRSPVSFGDLTSKNPLANS